MKIALMIILSIVLMSCKKDNVISNPLIGDWELSAEINGQTGIKTNYESGKGNISKFTETTYEIIRDSKAIRKGTYSIITYQAMITQKEEKQIIYDGIPNQTNIYFTIENNTLSIAADAYDGPSTIFKRIK